MADRDDLRTRVAQMLSLSTTALSNDLIEIDARLDQAYEDILVRTRCKVNCADLVLTAGEWKYTLPTGILAITEIWAPDSDLPFERTTTERILKLQRGVQSLSDGVRYYGTEGMNLLLIWPTPTETQEIDLFYVPRPGDWSDGDDSPSYIPAEFHRALEYYALWHLAGRENDSQSVQGERWRIYYEGQDGRGGMINEIKKQTRWRGGRRLAPIDFSQPVRNTGRSVDLGVW
jgi:hypothetical protein